MFGTMAVKQVRLVRAAVVAPQVLSPRAVNNQTAEPDTRVKKESRECAENRALCCLKTSREL